MFASLFHVDLLLKETSARGRDIVALISYSNKETERKVSFYYTDLWNKTYIVQLITCCIYFVSLFIVLYSCSCIVEFVKLVGENR